MAMLRWVDEFGVNTSINSTTGPATTTIDGLDVEIVGDDLSPDSDNVVRNFAIHVEGSEFDGAGDRLSELKIYSGGTDPDAGDGPSFDVSTVCINFGTEDDPSVRAGDLKFAITAIGGDGITPQETVIVRAYDELGNEVDVTYTLGSNVTDNPFADEYIGGPDDRRLWEEEGSVQYEIAGPVAKLEIIYTNEFGSGVQGNQFIGVSNINFEVVQLVDHFRFPSEDTDDFPDDDHDSVDGTSGDDTISTGDDADTINGGDGNDSLDGGWDDDTITGGGGEDTIDGGRGNDTIDGGTGDDSIDAGGDPSRDDYSDYESLILTDTPDDPKFVPSGIEGFFSDPNPDDDRDSVLGRGGEDYIFTGDDADTISGGDDNDTLDGGIDDDLIFGDGGRDSIIGGHGSDTIEGGFGDDYIQASDSTLLYPDVPDDTDPIPENDRDSVEGGGGDDTIFGGDDDDTLSGGTGTDEIYGGIDEDEIYGGRDNDTLFGGDGDDVLYGDEGDDTIYGDDSTTGGDGADTMFGGDDRDYFRFINIGDVIDGNEGGDDHDTLDLRVIDTPGIELIPGVDILIDDPDTIGNPGGSILIDYDAGNFENGTATYFDSGFSAIGSFSFENIENIIIPCFTPGTRIATPRGELCVEDLEVGDRIITRDNGIQEIRWMGVRSLKGQEYSQLKHLRPVLIKKGALGNNLPERDMKVSPNHRMLVANEKTAFYFEESEVLVAAKHLVGLPGVEFAEVDEVTYIHFMFDQHEVVLSDGAWSESFQPGDWTMNGIGNAQRTEILELFPELARPEGIAAYQSARRSLRKFEAQLLVQ